MMMMVLLAQFAHEGAEVGSKRRRGGGGEEQQQQ